MDSSVTLIGNLTRDPELRFTQGGSAVTSLGVAVNRRWLDRTTNQWQEATAFVDVTAWADLGENIAESLHKGDRVIVSGTLRQDTWKDADGNNRSKLVVVADEVAPSLRFATVTDIVKVTKADRQPATVGAPAEGEEPF